MSSDLEKLLQKAELIYVQPVAMGVSRILRSRSERERLEACLKAAEIITRYLAGVSLASYACRSEEGDADAIDFSESMDGPLSWGAFFAVVQKIYDQAPQHPAKSYLSPFRNKKQNKPSPEDHIQSLLEIRNRLSHDLNTLSTAQAKKHLDGSDGVESKLCEILRVMEVSLSSPLMVVEETKYAKKSFATRLLWLMGDSPDPKPVELNLESGIEETNQPYVILGESMIKLWPFFAWDMMEEKLNRYVLLQIDKIAKEKLFMKPIEPYEKSFDGLMPQVSDMLSAKRVEPETAPMCGSDSLNWIWVEEKKQREASQDALDGSMPWQDFDEDILTWYAKKLDSTFEKSPRVVIGKVLFDGRERFEPSDIRQAQLLFGTKECLAKILSRDLIDLRSMSAESIRWDERISERINVLSALRLSVEFFVKHSQSKESSSMDDLVKTDGSSDYLAMREALVNIFIHQDYSDNSSAAQIELKPSRAMFANPGYSMVSEERLTEGGKSQARNPLIARALRLIGFAELAGSGLRVLTHTWRTANRWPPKFESDNESNSFTLTLDWRSVEDYYDPELKEKLGVKLTTEQACIFNLVRSSDGISMQQASAGTGLSLDGTKKCINYLTTQKLVENNKGTISLAEHLDHLRIN
jgi:predicted HTH transcriptional regulator